jgi:hypothetical protein
MGGKITKVLIVFPSSPFVFLFQSTYLEDNLYFSAVKVSVFKINVYKLEASLSIRGCGQGMLDKTNRHCPSSVAVIPCTRAVAVDIRPAVAPDSTELICLNTKHSPLFSTDCLHFSLNDQHR